MIGPESDKNLKTFFAKSERTEGKINIDGQLQIHLSSSALYHHRALKSFVGINQVHESSEESFKQYMVMYISICHYHLGESPEQLN